MGEIVKRQEDAEGEDHTEDRHPPIDWKVVAPRWMLVAILGLLVFALGWVLSDNKNLSDDRLARMERYQSDSRWALLTQYGTEIALIRGDLRNQEARLKAIEGMADDVKTLRILAEREAARKRRAGGGGYGL